MAAYTFTILKDKIAARLGSLPSSDPFYGQLGNWANKATNGTIMRVLSKNRRFYNLFPELEDKWQDTTVVSRALTMTGDATAEKRCPSYV